MKFLPSSIFLASSSSFVIFDMIKLHAQVHPFIGFFEGRAGFFAEQFTFLNQSNRLTFLCNSVPSALIRSYVTL